MANQWIGTSVISPTGTVHPATFFHHDEVCEGIVEVTGLRGSGYPGDILAQHGYIKITSDGCVRGTDYSYNQTVTQAQFDAIFDMAVAISEGVKPDDGRMTSEGLLTELQRLEVK